MVRLFLFRRVFPIFLSMLILQGGRLEMDFLFYLKLRMLFSMPSVDIAQLEELLVFVRSPVPPTLRVDLTRKPTIFFFHSPFRLAHCGLSLTFKLNLPDSLPLTFVAWSTTVTLTTPCCSKPTRPSPSASYGYLG